MKLITLNFYLLVLCISVYANSASIDFEKAVAPNLDKQKAFLSAPVADFSVNDSTLSLGGSAYFTDHSSNSPTSWTWTFQGGTPSSSSEQNPQNIIYYTSGSYDVSLIVTNADGADTLIKTQYINVSDFQSAWIKQNTGFTSAWGIKQISIVDSSVVWAKAYDRIYQTNYISDFTRTTNGGNTWIPGIITFTGSSSFGCSNIIGISDSTAFSCFFPLSGTGGKIVKTIDGGNTWTETSASFTNSWANFVYFFNANDGIAMGDPYSLEFVILTTSDGGDTWTQVSGADIPNAQTGEYGTLNDYDVVGNTIWFPTNSGNVYKSTDKGLHWVKTPNGFLSTARLIFKNDNIGFAVNSETPNNLKKTNDGGASWIDFVPTGEFSIYPHLDFVPGTSSTWINVSSNLTTKSSYSTDDGYSFISIDQGVSYTTVKFHDIHTGWAGGITTSATDGGIYKWNQLFITVNNETAFKENNNITLYPIPAKNIINILLKTVEDDDMTITFYNITGQVVVSKQVKAISNDIVQIDCSGIDAGLYFISINNGNKTITKKVTIIK